MSSCSLTINFAGGQMANTCVTQGNECDPLLQNCTPTTNACYPTQAGLKCLMPGAVADGMTCQYANDCVKGSACFNLSSNPGNKCYKMCTAATDGGMADAGAQVTCSTGTCAAVAPPTALGVCQ